MGKMGSSKKHKEKDRDREHKRKKHKRSRSRSRSRERKSRRQHSPENVNVDRFAFRDGRDSYRDGRDRERERYADDYNDYSAPPAPPDSARKEDAVDLGKEQLSLSIEETNKLRAKLGLKPLEAGQGESSSKSKENQDVHVPAINLSEKLNTQKLREKMLLMKEKRKVKDKLRAVKALGESDSDEDDVFSWVKKNRKISKEKEMADRRAKMLEEMDAEFGVANLVEQEFEAGKKNTYTSGDLSGLRVEHGMEKFKEGARVILTLKDKGVLDDEDDDVLVNVNIIDDEIAEKNVENKKKKPDYKPYDEPEMDEYGMFKEKDVLDKYDEEIHGEKKESFVLGSGGQYDAEHERNMEIIRQQLRRQGQALTGPAPTIASEYMTREEMEAKAKFKKVKKKVRRIRKKELLRADDLLPLPDQVAEPSDYGSRRRGRGVSMEVKDEEAELEQTMEQSRGAAAPPQESSMEEDAAFYTGILPVKEEPDFKPPLPPPSLLPPPPPPPFSDDDNMLGPDQDLTGVAVEEELVRQELQSVLNKTRRLQQRRDRKLGVQKVMENLVKKEEDMESHSAKPPSRGISASTGGKGASNIILNSTSEFCRSLGEIPTYGLSGNREEEREEIMDLELELMEQRKQEQEMEEQASGWAEVDIDTNPVNILGEEKSVLEEEPIVTESIGAALQLAQKKGYLENEGQQKATPSSKHSHLQAQNYSIEDKRYDDLDEKYRKRDRYGGGMITDFKDKEGYRPEIRLEYVDESGRNLNPKEAFRQLSHRFHGKGSGKKKTEKRQKKVEEEQLMKHMSSTDTPLNTLSMLQDKQRSEKSPYVVLSGNKTFSSASQTLSKPH